MLDNVLICFVLFFLFYNSIEFLNALFQHFFLENHGHFNTGSLLS